MTDMLARDLAAVETVVQSAANGDEVAFARLVAEHHVSMARVAFVICGDVETTSDAVQSAWVIAWRRLRSLRDPIRVWIFHPNDRAGARCCGMVVIEAETYAGASPEIEREIQRIIDSVSHGG
jgi:hypothetical protein